MRLCYRIQSRLRLISNSLIFAWCVFFIATVSRSRERFNLSRAIRIAALPLRCAASLRLAGGAFHLRLRRQEAVPRT